VSDALTIGGAGAAAAAASAPKPAPAPTAAKQAEGFERVLLGQLTKELVETAMPDDENASAATGTYKQMLPDALTEALMSGGGIGLATQLAAANGKSGKASS
jgi:Rod binding domain-containing protein